VAWEHVEFMQIHCFQVVRLIAINRPGRPWHSIRRLDSISSTRKLVVRLIDDKSRLIVRPGHGRPDCVLCFGPVLTGCVKIKTALVLLLANYGLLWYCKLPAASHQRNRVWDKNLDLWTVQKREENNSHKSPAKH
jgi:hypothetical protein